MKGALLEDPRLIEGEEEEKKNPMGLMHITSLRLADIFSDDSNFRNLVMDQIVREISLRNILLQSAARPCTLASVPANCQSPFSCGLLCGSLLSTVIVGYRLILPGCSLICHVHMDMWK